MKSIGTQSSNQLLWPDMVEGAPGCNSPSHGDMPYLMGYHSQGMDGCNDDDVIKWNHFPRYWPFVRGIHRSPVNSPYKGQWRGAFMFSLICAWINGLLNNGEASWWFDDAHYDVTVMMAVFFFRPQEICNNTDRWLSARLQYLQCFSSGDTAILH